jgi:hypothetical protein
MQGHAGAMRLISDVSSTKRTKQLNFQYLQVLEREQGPNDWQRKTIFGRAIVLFGYPGHVLTALVEVYGVKERM